jgi:predicted metal-dependent HD superfamily phosphohydrolase
MGLAPILCIDNYSIDFTYHFHTNRFIALGLFLLSTAKLYMRDNATVNNAYVFHDVDKTSDHKPNILEL